MASTPTIRQRLYKHLDPEAWPERGLSPLNWFLFFLILMSILFGILATEPNIQQVGHHRLVLAERLILFIFLLEVLARIWVSGLNPKFSGSSGLWRYLIRPATIADIIVVIPLFLATPPMWTMIFRLLRILRLVRLASFPQVQEAAQEFAEALNAKRFELTLTACMGIVLILVASTLLYVVEKDVQPEIFGSIPRAIWWSVVTFTTVGYGDAVPVTAIGRFSTGIFAISGICVVAMLTGVIASALSEAAEEHQRKRLDNGEDGEK